MHGQKRLEEDFSPVAGLLEGALRVALASDGGAPDLGTPLKALFTSTIGLVAPVVALGIGPAWVLHEAGRNAAAVIAGLGVQALFIRLAAGIHTLNLRMAHCTLWAEAD